MNTDELAEELAKTYASTPREPGETKWVYQDRMRQLTLERVSREKIPSAAIDGLRMPIDTAIERLKPTKPVRITEPVSKAQSQLPSLADRPVPMKKHFIRGETFSGRKALKVGDELVEEGSYIHQRAIVHNAYLKLVRDFIDSGQELSDKMVAALATILQSQRR